MRMKMGLLAICLLGAVEIAQAGAVFRVEVENFSEDNQFFEGGKSYTTVTKVEGDRMRSDIQGEDGEMATSVIFLGETDEMYMIDHKKKTCLVLDRESIEALGKQMSEVMKQMEAALAKVPPGQREMMERMMKKQLAADPNYKEPSPPLVRSLGESGSVNGIACEWKEVTRDDALSEKACICVAGLTELAKSASSFKLFGGGTMEDVGMAMTADLEGFPLISEHFDGEGKLMRRSTFQSADEVSIPVEEFTPPNNYKKQTMQQMTR